jgi:hypothetical protein
VSQKIQKKKMPAHVIMRGHARSFTNITATVRGKARVFVRLSAKNPVNAENVGNNKKTPMDAQQARSALFAIYAKAIWSASKIAIAAIHVPFAKLGRA